LTDIVKLLLTLIFQTGLLSAEDIDRVCHDGLGMRYAFIGPLETMHLNADGTQNVLNPCCTCA